MKPIYIAAYYQSKFGKLMGMTVPEIVDAAVQSACRQIDAPASALDVGSIGAACNFSLNRQGLLAGLMAMTPGLEGKPIEAVENACASGGQAVLSVIHKLQLAKLLVKLKADLSALPKDASDDDARKVFSNAFDDLLAVNKCPDFIVNRGHYFGTDFFQEEPGLSDADKQALIAFLKTM